MMKGNPSQPGKPRKNEPGASVPKGSDDFGTNLRGQHPTRPAELGVKGWMKGTGGSLCEPSKGKY